MALAALLLLAAGWCWGRANAKPGVVRIVYVTHEGTELFLTYGMVVDGTTYVPLRSIMHPVALQMYGLPPIFDVSWDGGQVTLRDAAPERRRVELSPVSPQALPSMPPPSWMGDEACDE